LVLVVGQEYNFSPINIINGVIYFSPTLGSTSSITSFNLPSGDALRVFLMNSLNITGDLPRGFSFKLQLIIPSYTSSAAQCVMSFPDVTYQNGFNPDGSNKHLDSFVYYGLGPENPARQDYSFTFSYQLNVDYNTWFVY